MSIDPHDFMENFDIVSDVTNYSNYTVPPKYEGILIHKGKWRFRVGNPISADTSHFKNIVDQAIFVDVDGQFQAKEFEVYKVKYLPEEDKLDIYVEVKENPIPIFVIWGAVIIATSIAVALSANSVLEEVEEVTDTLGSNIKKIGFNPIALGIVAIFLIPLLIKGKKAL